MAGMSLKAVRAVLIDLSGTIHIQDYVIPGSIEAIKRLREANLKVKFVTNTTKESKQCLIDRLVKLGFEINSNEVFTSLTAARRHVEIQSLRPMCLLDDRASADFKGVETKNPNCVLVGLAPDKFNYHTLNNAFRLLLDGASLVAVHKARYYMAEDGLKLGPGPFVTALEYATGLKATVVGKPEVQFFQEALKELDCHPKEAVMIGDDVRDDVIGAQAAGIHGILVKTGKYQVNDEIKYEMKPEVTKDTFSSAVDYILENISSK